MFVFRAHTITLLAGLLVATTLPTPAFAGQKARPEQAPRPKPQQQPQRQLQKAQPRPNANNHPGDELFNKLQHMTPEEREKALSQLPPARRAQIEERIRKFQELAPAVQARRLDRLDRLLSLPPQRQNEVRRSMNQLQNLPDDRKKAINQELRSMSVMPDYERQVHMNTDEFRNRFSPAERQIVGDLAEIE
jgi:hypothetical protein